jgi:hypothetical protein
MASPPGSTPLLRHSTSSTEMLLDGVPLCFMLRRFSRPNRARGEVPVKIGRHWRKNALLLGLESCC